MSDRHLIYFADPMCSWCYGFWPVIAAVQAAFGETLPIRLVMGGLRPGTTEVMMHPGTDNSRLIPACDWEHDFEAEMQAIVSPKVRRMIADKAVKVVNYRDLK